MKAIAAVAALAASAAIAMPSQMLGSGETYSGRESMVVKSIYCINPASGANTNESAATLKMTTRNEYYKTVPWLIDSYGEFEVPSWLDCTVYYGPTLNPYGALVGKIPRLNPDSKEGDPNLYEGTIVGMYTNRFAEGEIFSNVVALVSTYTDQQNINLHIECVVTNLTGENLPKHDASFWRQSITKPVNTYLYISTNDQNGIKVGLSINTNNVIKTYTKGQKKVYFAKDENYTIATLSPGTSAYAVTNDVNYLVPFGFKLQTQTVSPFTKIGFTYE